VLCYCARVCIVLTVLWRCCGRGGAKEGKFDKIHLAPFLEETCGCLSCIRRPPTATFAFARHDFSAGLRPLRARGAV